MICPILAGFVILNEWVNVVYFCNSYLVLIIMADYLYANTLVIIWTWVVDHCHIYHSFEVLKWVTGICNRVTFMCLGDNREVGFDWSQGKLH
jgi:hypothetical protein